MINRKITSEQQPLTITAAAGDVEGDAPKGPPRVESNSYNGGKMGVGWPHPVVVDLERSNVAGSHPIYRSHSDQRIVGHGQSEVVRAEDGGLSLRTTGTLSSKKLEAGNTDVAEIVELAAEAFPWQASIGARPVSSVLVPAGKTKRVNGRDQAGPFFHVVAELQEVSIVPRGADSSTSTSIAATEQSEMENQEQYETEQAAGERTENLTAAAGSNTSSNLAEIKRERERRDAIEAKGIELIKAGADIDAIEKSMNSAVVNGTSVQEFELGLLRQYSRPQGKISAGRGNVLQGERLEAAVEASVLKTLNWSASMLEAEFDEQTLNAMDKDTLLRDGLSLKDVLCFSAEQNGIRTSRHNPEQMLRAAFSPSGNIQASGMTTFSLSGILSNIANKQIRRWFMQFSDLKSTSGDAGLQAYGVLGSVATVTDFKTRTAYALTGDMTYEEVAPGGELKHGTLGEETYTNRAKTYGKIAGVDRTDIINDDLGAFNQIGQKLGLGAARKLSDVFWTTFFADSTFFPTDKTKKNYIDGASSALSIDSLSTAEAAFIEQTDPDGRPLGVMPSIGLVAPALAATFATLMSSQQIVSGSGSARPANNPHGGKFRGYTSPFVSNASYGNSSTLWYLLADPMVMPVIETVFLNGRQQPTVEQAQADFNQLGVQFRGYHDFGVSLQEFRGGQKVKGAA